MYTLINENNNLKGKFIYYARIEKYANSWDIVVKKYYIRLDRTIMLHAPQEEWEIRQLTYLGGHINLFYDKLKNNNSFKYHLTNTSIISTEKMEIQRFIRKITTPKNIHITNEMENVYRINKALNELKKL